jgi:hypothetical protein
MLGSKGFEMARYAVDADENVLADCWCRWRIRVVLMFIALSLPLLPL